MPKIWAGNKVQKLGRVLSPLASHIYQTTLIRSVCTAGDWDNIQDLIFVSLYLLMGIKQGVCESEPWEMSKGFLKRPALE